MNLETNTQNLFYRYYPDQEVVYWTTDGVTEEKLCSIEVIKDKLPSKKIVKTTTFTTLG